MTQTPARPIKKKPVAGSIAPRWPKPKVVAWLEIGAIPAIVGLWFPDWIGAYGQGSVPYLPPLLPPFPPVLAYVGAVILLVACYQGIKDMGTHFRGVVVSGGLALASAAGSIIAQLLDASALSLLLTGLAAVASAGFFWFTIGKVAEITQETRTWRTWWAVAVFTVLTAAVYLTGVYFYAFVSVASAMPVLRAGIVLLTVTFGLCRYGVHCYKTQTSIGAGFRSAPGEQYWAPVE